MAKKDEGTRLNIEREHERKGSNPEHRDNARCDADKQDTEKTEVKNAHATGLGAMGRNDQRLDQDSPDFNNY